MKIKKIIHSALLLSALSSTTYAAIPGVYLGAGAGYNSMRDFTNATASDAGGLGGTLFAGYNFNEYVGLEASYRQFTDTNYYFDDNSNLGFETSMHSFNLVAKGYIPFGLDDRFNLYVFLGASNVHVSNDVNYLNIRNITSESNSAILATAGIGLDYAVNQHVTVGVEYTGTQGQSGDDNHIGIPGSDMVNLTLAYHIG